MNLKHVMRSRYYFLKKSNTALLYVFITISSIYILNAIYEYRSINQYENLSICIDPSFIQKQTRIILMLILSTFFLYREKHIYIIISIMLQFGLLIEFSYWYYISFLTYKEAGVNLSFTEKLYGNSYTLFLYGGNLPDILILSLAILTIAVKFSQIERNSRVELAG